MANSSDGNGNGNRSLGDTATSIANNSIAVIFARYVMPIILAVIGWLMVDKMGSIHDESTKLGTEVREMGKDLGKKVDAVASAAIETHTELKVLSVQVNANRERGEARANDLESKVITIDNAAARKADALQARIDEMIRTMLLKQKPATPAPPTASP